MKLTFKIYQQPDADFEIDAEVSETIGDLKAKIKDLKGHDVGKQNIIFCGKGLANDRTLESYRISGKGFLVLSISRPRPPLPVPRQLNAEEYFALSEEELAHFPLGPPPTGPASDPGNTPVLPPTSASTFKYIPMSSSALDIETTSVSTFKHVPVSSPSSAPVSAATSSPPPTSSASTFKYVPVSSSAPVPRTTSVSTFKYIPLSASSSAAIPAATSTPVPPTTSASTFKSVPASSSASASGHTPASTSTGVSSSFPSAGRPQHLSRSTATLQQGRTLGARIPTAGPGGLANGPQIAQFRQLITQDPEFRQHFIQQLGQEDPELGQLLTRNPDLLLQFLDRIGEDRDASSGGAQAVRVSVSEAERATIERLEGLGFPRQAVIEAYFACDKNEELAANYLLEHS